MIMKSSTWHRDSHGLFDYESKNITPNYIRCNYSSTYIHQFFTLLALLYRVDNNVIFEELKTMDKSSTAISTVLQKDSKPFLPFVNPFVDNYWIYHKNVIEEYEEEKINPADKAWLIVKYINAGANASQRVSYACLLTF